MAACMSGVRRSLAAQRVDQFRDHSDLREKPRSPHS
jgi:hypothetical protein